MARQGRDRGRPGRDFWEAEPEHQDYLERYPNGYTCHFVRPHWQLPHKEEAGSRRAALEETTPAWPLLRQKPGSLRPSESRWDANWLGC